MTILADLYEPPENAQAADHNKIIHDVWLPGDEHGPWLNTGQPGILPFLRPNMVSNVSALKSVQRYLHQLLIGREWSIKK